MRDTTLLNYERLEAEVLNGQIPRASLRGMVHRNEIPHIRIGPRTVLFDKAEVLAWLEARRQPGKNS